MNSFGDTFDDKKDNPEIEQVSPAPEQSDRTAASADPKLAESQPDSPRNIEETDAPTTPDLFPDEQEHSKPDPTAVLKAVRDELASILNDLDPDSP